MRLILNQLAGVFGFLVFKRHGVRDALYVVRCGFPYRPFGKFGKRTGLRNEQIHESRVARRPEINVNQVHYWPKLYREAPLESWTETQLVPLKVGSTHSTLWV